MSTNMAELKTQDSHFEEHAKGEKGEKSIETVNHKGDLSAEFYANYGGPRRDIDDADNDRVRWKIDRFLLPIVCYIYFCQQLDKSTMSFAAVFNIQQDANLVGQQYSWLNSIIYFAQLVFQPLSVYALVKVPVNIWICSCFTAWSVVLIIMTAMKSFAGLAALRFFLGGFEASIAPSMLIVSSMWWTRREQILRNNIWYSMNGMAQILGSLLSYGLGHIKSDTLHEYQVIFLGIGLISLAFSLPTWFLFPRHPARVRWLSQDDKYVALERIRLNQTGTQTHEFKWAQVREAILDPKSILFAVMVFCISLVSGGITSFGPLILQGFGLSTFQTILYNMIPGAISIVSNVITAVCITKTKYKTPVLFVASLFPLAAAVALYQLPRGDQYKSKLLAVYFILNVYQCITPIIFSWTFANTAGHTKKTTMTGLLYVGLCVGNIVGPQLYRKNQAPYYHTGLQANMAVLCILSGCILLQAFYLTMLNKRNVKRRIAAGKTGQLVDYSLEASSKWKALRSEQAARDQAEGHVAAEHTEGIADLTDLKNEDFVYSL